MRRIVAVVLPLAPIAFFTFSALAQQNTGPAYPTQTAGSSTLTKSGQSSLVHPAAPTPAPPPDRAIQIHLQYQGLSAFNDIGVQQKLLLTPGQIQKLRNYNNTQTLKWHEVLRFNRNDRNGVKNAYDSLVGQTALLIKSVLTPQQFKQWCDLIGPPQQFEPHWVEN
jgi:hypothetical protein